MSLLNQLQTVHKSFLAAEVCQGIAVVNIAKKEPLTDVSERVIIVIPLGLFVVFDVSNSYV